LHLGASFTLDDVTLLRISELAAQAGVPASTLRYYERIGLIEPVARGDNGYRMYDPRSLERLAFIGRAKRLGMSLDDVSTLVDVWFAGECEPLQEKLRAFVTGRIAELHAQIAEESAFERQMQRILVRLGEGGAASSDGRCRPDCGCDVDPLDLDSRPPPAGLVACSLDALETSPRVAAWREVLATALRAEWVGTRLTISFVRGSDIVGRLGGLCVAETSCCPFYSFDVAITAAAIVLTVDVPNDQEQTLAWLAALCPVAA